MVNRQWSIVAGHTQIDKGRRTNERVGFTIDLGLLDMAF